MSWEPKIEKIYENGVLVSSTIQRTPNGPKEALAQPEQEPDWKGLVLAHNAECDERCDKERCGYAPYFEANGRRCPTCPVHEKIDVDTPPQRKPLTDEQKYALIEKHLGLKKRRNETVIDQYTGLFYAAKPYLDLIDEAAHGIKE